MQKILSISGTNLENKMMIKIISADKCESQTEISTWGNLEAKFSQIKNCHNLGFRSFVHENGCKKNLSFSQHLFYEWHQMDRYRNVCALHIPFANNFCHNLIDFLPELLYLEGLEKYNLILAPYSDVTDKFINFFDINLNKTKFIKNNFNFIPQTIDLYQYHKNQRSTNKSLNLREILLKKINIKAAPDKLIYCTRNTGNGAKHGRKMNPSNEAEIVKFSRDYANKHDLELVVFDGHNEDKSKMSIIDQANLFSQAKIVAGPHGGAFANIIYIPSDNNCKVCEFTSGKYTNVQGEKDFVKNYNRLLGFAPETYLDYYLIPFEVGSDNKETFINIDNYKCFLNSIDI